MGATRAASRCTVYGSVKPGPASTRYQEVTRQGEAFMVRHVGLKPAVLGTTEDKLTRLGALTV